MKTAIYSVLFILALIVACNAQPKSDYELYSNPVSGATKYLFFLEKQSGGSYQLTEGMDYLSVIHLQVGEAAIPVFTVNLNNDGSEYMVGVVAVDIEGIYSGMGTGIGTVGDVPNIPAGVGLRKK